MKPDTARPRSRALTVLVVLLAILSAPVVLAVFIARLSAERR
jgi:hypothetical protein